MATYRDLRRVYGEEVCGMMKNLTNLENKVAHITNQKIFLMKCRQNGVYPKHIVSNIKCVFNLNSYTRRFNHIIDKTYNNFRKSLLNIEIKISHWAHKQINKEINKLSHSLDRILPTNLLKSWRLTIDTHANKIFKRIKINNQKKLKYLIEIQKPFTKQELNNCVKNMTDIKIPKDVLNIISFGPKFAYPLTKTEFEQMVPTMIKDTEYILLKSDIEYTKQN